MHNVLNLIAIKNNINIHEGSFVSFKPWKGRDGSLKRRVFEEDKMAF